MRERTYTRFLVITHHPLTMARMHRLFGVTMMERGVSQLVSVDLETAGTQEVSAHTVNGRVRAKFLQSFQGANLKTVNGSVDAVLPPTASFACDVAQVNGDFEASFPLSIHSHPGSRRVSGEVNGGKYDLRIVTVNGDIHLEGGVAPKPPAAPAQTPANPTEPPKPAAPPLPST